MKNLILFSITCPLLVVAAPYPEISTSGLTKRDHSQKCTIFDNVQCWYQGFEEDNQVRCVNASDLKFLYSKGVCQDTLTSGEKEYAFAYSSCVSKSKYERTQW